MFKKGPYHRWFAQQTYLATKLSNLVNVGPLFSVLWTISIGCITQEKQLIFMPDALGLENCPFLFKKAKLVKIAVHFCFNSRVVLV